MGTNRLDVLLPRTAKGAFVRAWGLALAAGLGIILVIGPLTGLSGNFGGSSHDGYIELARSLARGDGFVFEPGGDPVIHRPPLVPLLFVPVALMPERLERPALVVLQSLMAGAICGLLFDLARRAFNLRVARWSVLLLLLYPWLYWHVKNPLGVLSQTLAVAMVVNLLAREWLAGSPDGPEHRQAWPLRALVLGLAAGSALLTHATLVVSAPLILGATLAAALWRRKPEVVYVGLLAGLVAVLTVAPWTYRNWVLTGRLIPVAGNGGLAYFWGNAHLRFPGDRTQGREYERALVLAGVRRNAADVIHFSGLRDPKLDDILNRKMVEHIKAHPDLFAKKVTLDAMEFYVPVCYYVLGPGRLSWDLGVLARWAISLWHLAFWGLAVVGIWRAPTAESRLRLLAVVGCIAALTMPYFPFFVSVGHSQYVMPTMPLVAVLAAAGWTSLLSKRDPQSAGEPA